MRPGFNGYPVRILGAAVLVAMLMLAVTIGRHPTEPDAGILGTEQQSVEAGAAARYQQMAVSFYYAMLILASERGELQIEDGYISISNETLLQVWEEGQQIATELNLQPTTVQPPDWGLEWRAR